MATLPGVPLYAKFGFVEIGRTTVRVPDGVDIECAEMERPVRDPLPQPSPAAAAAQ